MMRFKKKLLACFTALSCFLLFSQETLNNLNTSWSNVLSGVILSEPAITSYGFCAVTDARYISAFSNNGKTLWEKSTGRSKNILLKALPDDFILYCDLSSEIIKLLNPSGTEIWNKKLPYQISSNPVAGRDGRFFICGEQCIECYGINGICKWSIQTPIQKNIPVQELSDGSIVVFLRELQGKTKGLRITPFGEIIEEITFAGEIKSAFSCDSGILLTFKDGSAGLFSLSNNLSENKWVLPKKNNNSTFVVGSNLIDFLYVEFLPDGVVLNEIDKGKGVITHSIKIKDINGSKIEKLFYNDYGILLVDNKNAGLYTSDGKQLWYARLPDKNQKNNWNHLIYTNDNHLVFCYKNWTLNAYRIAQGKLSNNSTKKDDRKYIYEYEESFDTQYSNSFSSELLLETRITQLREGYYSTSEEQWQKEIYSICNSYSRFLSTSDFGTRKEKSIFEQDSTGFQNILEQLMLFGNQDSQNIAANILSKTNNKAYQKVILQGISTNGYDASGQLLSALEKMAKQVSYKDKIVINGICDAVYSICFFMGRPAYNSKGKNILKNFLYPSYDAKTKDYARDTLKKIIELEL